MKIYQNNLIYWESISFAKIYLIYESTVILAV